MSSHHIVRENQEPALLVAAAGVLDSEQMGQLLEWSPTILADDQTVDFLLAEQIKVDIVFTNRLAPGRFFLTAGIAKRDGTKLDMRFDCLMFEVMTRVRRLYDNSLVAMDMCFVCAAETTVLQSTERSERN